jgi:FLVCR family feline leukemia virus subgroup C receptor-related protein
MALGVIWTFTSVISVLLLPFNYTQLQIGLIGLWANLTGTIGGTLASIFIDH